MMRTFGIELHKWEVGRERDLVLLWIRLGWFSIYFGQDRLSPRLKAYADKMAEIARDPGKVWCEDCPRSTICYFAGSCQSLPRNPRRSSAYRFLAFKAFVARRWRKLLAPRTSEPTAVDLPFPTDERSEK